MIPMKGTTKKKTPVNKWLHWTRKIVPNRADLRTMKVTEGTCIDDGAVQNIAQTTIRASVPLRNNQYSTIESIGSCTLELACNLNNSLGTTSFPLRLLTYIGLYHGVPTKCTLPRMENPILKYTHHRTKQDQDANVIVDANGGLVDLFSAPGADKALALDAA